MVQNCHPSVVGVRRPSPVVVVRRPFRRRRPLSCPASVRRPSRRRRRPLSVRPVRPSSSVVVMGGVKRGWGGVKFRPLVFLVFTPMPKGDQGRKKRSPKT